MTDVNLPGLSGRGFAAKAREMREGIAIVFVTGDGSVEHNILAAIIMTKPYDMEAMSTSASEDVVKIVRKEIKYKTAAFSNGRDNIRSNPS